MDELRKKRRESIALLDELLQSTFLDMFGDPVTNPKGWEMTNIGEVTNCIVPGRDKPKSFSGEIPWVTTEDLQEDGYTSYSSSQIGLTREEISFVRARIIPEGSVLMSCVGDLGRTSISNNEMVVNQQLHTFQNKGQTTSEFLATQIPYRKPWLLQRATQTTLPYLNKTNCNSIPIILPPLDIQLKYSEIYNKVVSERNTQNAYLAELDTLFASLQQRAFNGEL